MREECSRLLARIGDIPNDELLLVKRTISAYLSTTQGFKLEESPQVLDKPLSDEDLLLTSLLAVMKSLGLQVRSAKTLSSSVIFRANWEKSKTVIVWASSVKDKMSRKVLYEFSLRCLYDFLCEGVPVRWDRERQFLTRHRSGAVGIREMLIFLDYVPSVMESAFPGYRASGLLHLIPVSTKNRSSNVRSKRRVETRPEQI